jgi:Flp pilus assembly protein TadG
MTIIQRPVAGPRARSQSRHATAAVEFAAILPLIVMLLVGLWEGGRLIEVEQILNNAAREGARRAASGQLNYSQVQAVVTNYLSNAGIPTGNVVVTIQNLGFPGNPTPPDNNPQDATQLDQLKVSVAMPLSDVQWTTLSLVTNASTQLNAYAIWSSLKDIPYPTVSYPLPE